MTDLIEELLPEYEEVLNEVKRFIQAYIKTSFGGNQWFRTQSGILSFYLRINKRLFEGQIKICIDIATIEIAEEHQKRGIASRLIQDICEISSSFSSAECTYIENVLVPEFAAYLERTEWIRDPRYEWNFNYYKFTK